jgi:hypothetical protein
MRQTDDVCSCCGIERLLDEHGVFICVTCDLAADGIDPVYAPHGLDSPAVCAQCRVNILTIADVPPLCRQCRLERTA